jgi:hypothetical protein
MQAPTKNAENEAMGEGNQACPSSPVPPPTPLQKPQNINKEFIFWGSQEQFAKHVASPSHHPLPLTIGRIDRNLSWHGEIKKDMRNKATGGQKMIH